LTLFYWTWSSNSEMLSPEEVDVYVRAYQQPGTVHGSCADYRAGGEHVALIPQCGPLCQEERPDVANREPAAFLAGRKG
jgi:hypothetical protein